MDFEDALRSPIPLAEAATYFLRLKTAAVDPPDETGQLEGEFAAPVEQVLKLMTEMVENELKTMYAYKAYGNSLRDLSHFAIADEFEEHAQDELEHTDFLLRRMAVIGGPVELADIPAPPATTDPNAIVETMVRMEQEGIERWRALLAMLGDNPSKYKVEEFLGRELEHLDELWQLRPYQGGAQPTAMMTRAPAAPTPEEPPAEQAPEALAQTPKVAEGMMPPTPMAALSPTAKGQNPIQASTPPALPAAGMGQHKTALALRGLPSAEGERLAKALESMGKGLGKKRSAVRQILPDLKTYAESGRHSIPKLKAAAAAKFALSLAALPHGQGASLNKAFDNIGRGLQAIPPGPGIAKQIAPEAKGLFARGRGSIPKFRKAAEAFKLALDQMGVPATEAPAEMAVQAPASPAQAFLANEQAATPGQEQNELGYYRQRMQEAMAQLEQQKGEAEQAAAHTAELEQQVQAAQAQQAQYQQMVSAATAGAASAQDDVLREQQASAAMRMAYQQLRGQLLNVASQEPPSTEMLAEQAAMTSPPGAQDPTAQPGVDPAAAGGAPGSPAPDGGAAPGGAPPGGAPAAAPAPAAPAAPAPAAAKDPTMAKAKPPAEAAPKTASLARDLGERALDEVKKRGPGALAGAAIAGGAETAYAHKSTDPLRKKVDRLSEEPKGGFGHAMNLAQAKARLAVADAVDKHPKAALLSGMAAGGLEGAIAGPGIVSKFRETGRNLKELRSSGG
jgi:bacterioferritin (cytochrome b1)